MPTRRHPTQPPQPSASPHTTTPDQNPTQLQHHIKSHRVQQHHNLHLLKHRKTPTNTSIQNIRTLSLLQTILPLIQHLQPNNQAPARKPTRHPTRTTNHNHPHHNNRHQTRHQHPTLQQHRRTNRATDLDTNHHQQPRTHTDINPNLHP